MRLMQSSLAALVLAATTLVPAKAMPVTDEVIFLLDSSGSISNPAPGGGIDLSNWTAQIAFAQSLYESLYRDDGSISFGLINFSGCSVNFTHPICADPLSGSNYRLRVEHDLTDGQSESDLDGLFAGLDESDFIRGHSWINDALTLARNMFSNSPNTGDDPTRTIVLLTDGSPTDNHEPWNVSQNFVSDTAQDLLALGVVLNLVAVDVDPATDPNFFGFTPNVAVLGDFSTHSALQLPSAAQTATAPAPASAALVLPLLLLVRQRRGRRR